MRRAPFFLVSLLLLTIAALAQPNRITTPIDSNQAVVIPGTVYGEALPQYDMGPVDFGTKLEHVTLWISPSPIQQAALDRLLTAQRDPASESYHQWLSPDQFGALFGLSSKDMERIAKWLQSEGFTIVQTARSRNWIAFSGTAEQLDATFHTEIHRFNIGGETHYANATNVSLPKALAGVVSYVGGLHDFLWKPFYLRHHSTVDILSPYYSSGRTNYLAPTDIATIYDIQNLYRVGYDGTNVNLVIVGQSNFASSDISGFRTLFSLPPINLTEVLASGCTDPGFNDAEIEADLDLEWSGAVARNANIIFDKCDGSHGGALTALQDAITNNRGSVVSVSFGSCEPANGQRNAVALQNLIQQANAQGITVMAASGDSGAAGCDPHSDPNHLLATGGLEVSLPSSVPEITAVGGTQFHEGSGTYWGNTGAGLGSALSYIPEQAWNQDFEGLAASGGGVSIYFTKPAWQAGSGVPDDGHRDVPDVAIDASPSHDGYMLCAQDSCAADQVFIVGGTSASSPVFAGVVAVLNQYLVQTGSAGKPGLGNVNAQLYPLAASTPDAFHDVTQGNNIEQCEAGTPANFPVSQQCPMSGQFGYSAGPGYDQVTGLGSVDSCLLVTEWTGRNLPATFPAMTLSESDVPIGTGPSVVSIQVQPICVTGTPTGTVSFLSNGVLINQAGNPVTLNSGLAAFNYDTTKLASGMYSITAVYSGDASFAGSSASATLKVGTPTTAVLNRISPSSVVVGSKVTLTASIRSGGTPPDGQTVSFVDGFTNVTLGSALLSKGVATLTTATIPAASYSVMAAYSGDANLLPSISSPQFLYVQDFALAANPASVTISTPGGTGSTTIVIIPYGGFNPQSVAGWECSGLPPESHCTFGTVSSTGQVALSITTTAVTAFSRPGSPRRHLFYAFLFPGFLGSVSLLRCRRARRYLQVLASIAVVGLAIVWLACGGGSGPSSSQVSGTPIGTSIVTISGSSGTLQHSTAITVTVQ